MMITFTTGVDNIIYNGTNVQQTLSEYDFRTEVGAEGWEQGICIDDEDSIEEYIEFAEDTLGWTVINVEH